MAILVGQCHLADLVASCSSWVAISRLLLHGLVLGVGLLMFALPCLGHGHHGLGGLLSHGLLGHHRLGVVGLLHLRLAMWLHHGLAGGLLNHGLHHALGLELDVGLLHHLGLALVWLHHGLAAVGLLTHGLLLQIALPWLAHCLLHVLLQ